ncbi:MAG: hypothetical protein ABJZ55_13545 [Fuerstiella sp.]
MSSYVFETPYPSNPDRVLFTQYPRRATIAFTHDDVVYEFRLENPQPLSAVTAALDDCYQFRVVDLDPQLDFGRYKIEIWDEDNDYAEFIVDSYELAPVDSAPVA